VDQAFIHQQRLGCFVVTSHLSSPLGFVVVLWLKLALATEGGKEKIVHWGDLSPEDISPQSKRPHTSVRTMTFKPARSLRNAMGNVFVNGSSHKTRVKTIAWLMTSPKQEETYEDSNARFLGKIPPMLLVSSALVQIQGAGSWSR
jgi:hypothetical protein